MCCTTMSNMLFISMKTEWCMKRAVWTYSQPTLENSSVMARPRDVEVMIHWWGGGGGGMWLFIAFTGDFMRTTINHAIGAQRTVSLSLALALQHFFLTRLSVWRMVCVGVCLSVCQSVCLFTHLAELFLLYSTYFSFLLPQVANAFHEYNLIFVENQTLAWLNW